jgi:hypothetical protein
MGLNDGPNEDNTSQLAHKPLQFKRSFPIQQYINFKLAVLAIASPGLINLFVRDGVHGQKDSNRSEMTVNRRNRPQHTQGAGSSTANAVVDRVRRVE